MTNAAHKIIVALDVATEREALTLVDQLRDRISIFKVGLQLYTAEGPEIVRRIRDKGAKVFLDLKLHDIPNTAGRAVESASQLGVQMLTIHLSGGSAMIRAAVEARSKDLLLLGVTVLTSMDEKALVEVGVSGRIDDHVLRLAKMGVDNGLDAFVASAHELKNLRAALGNKIKIVVPGIRPKDAESADQKRIMSPRQAVDAGADYLVIGRPITAHQNPVEAVAKILQELEG